MSSEQVPRRRPEPWAWLAYLLALGYLGLLVYLGYRPGGNGPIAAYRFGPPVLAISALLVLAIGAAWSFLRRPFLQRRRRGAFLCALLVFGFVSYPIPFPSSHEGRKSQVVFRLPVEGEWTVFWGGDKREYNRLAAFSPDQRWGLHLVVTEEGQTHRDEGRAKEDYYCFDRPVLAPADGVVVAARADLPDLEPRTPPGPGTPALGNHIVLEVAPEQYAFLSRLRSGSVLVAAGDAVIAGQELGRVGSSGFSRITPEPHLSVHLQDTPEPLWGQAIPWAFSDYRAGERQVERGLPRGGVDRAGELTGEKVRPGEP